MIYTFLPCQSVSTSEAAVVLGGHICDPWESLIWFREWSGNLKIWYRQGVMVELCSRLCAEWSGDWSIGYKCCRQSTEQMWNLWIPCRQDISVPAWTCRQHPVLRRRSTSFNDLTPWIRTLMCITQLLRRCLRMWLQPYTICRMTPVKQCCSCLTFHCCPCLAVSKWNYRNYLLSSRWLWLQLA